MYSPATGGTGHRFAALAIQLVLTSSYRPGGELTGRAADGQ
jgi:hypothetical protein